MENKEQFGELIRAGQTVVRIENDFQQAIALVHKRDEDAILQKVTRELEDSPAFAKKAFYSIPYQNRAEGTVSNVEGVSIGGSMAIARRWGNCATAGRVLEEKDDRIICEGVFMDYEVNVRYCRTVAVSRFFVPKGSHERRPLPEKMMQLAIAAGLSKAIRNAVLSGVPDGLKIQVLDLAKRIASHGTKKAPAKSLQDRVKDLLSGFEAQGVKTDQIRAYIGKDDIAEADYSKLLGALNALEDGMAKKEDLFGDPDAVKPQSKTMKHKPVKMEDIGLGS